MLNVNVLSNSFKIQFEKIPPYVGYFSTLSWHELKAFLIMIKLTPDCLDME